MSRARSWMVQCLPVLVFLAVLGGHSTASSPTLYSVSIQTSDGWYVDAYNGGGEDVTAFGVDPVSPWEGFHVYDLDGGALLSGDEVVIGTFGGYYLRAVNCGGGALDARAVAAGSWERFRLHVLSGSDNVVDFGEDIAIETSCGYFVVAEGGGGDYVNADRTVIGPWETFRLAAFPGS